MIEATHLKSLGVTEINISQYLTPLDNTLVKYGINTPLKISHFLAQVLHESGNLYYSEEIASGAAYEGRLDLGNVNPGDGVLFKGRGLIQITGRANYKAYSNYVHKDFEMYPEFLKNTDFACDSAGWFWSVFKKDKHGVSLNEMAEQDLFKRITKFVNGGTNGIEHRFNILKNAYVLFGVDNVEERIIKNEKEIK